MRNAAASLVVLALVAGCSTAAPRQSSGGVSIQWHKVASWDAAAKACGARARAAGHPNPAAVHACQWIEAGVCHIVAPDFKNVSEIETIATLGHEVKHCFDGAWHGANAITPQYLPKGRDFAGDDQPQPVFGGR